MLTKSFEQKKESIFLKSGFEKAKVATLGRRRRLSNFFSWDKDVLKRLLCGVHHHREQVQEFSQECLCVTDLSFPFQMQWNKIEMNLLRKKSSFLPPSSSKTGAYQASCDHILYVLWDSHGNKINSQHWISQK